MDQLLELLKSAIVNQPGKGKDDDVPAMLSQGEYVIPAEVVAALGDGNNDAGGSILDTLMELIRGMYGPAK